VAITDVTRITTCCGQRQQPVTLSGSSNCALMSLYFRIVRLRQRPARLDPMIAAGRKPHLVSRHWPLLFAKSCIDNPGYLGTSEAASSRTEHPGREMWCVWMFPQLRGGEAGAITSSDRACQCIAAPILLPARCCQRLAGPPEGHRARPSACWPGPPLPGAAV
jgi:hypothetical protein